MRKDGSNFIPKPGPQAPWSSLRKYRRKNNAGVVRRVMKVIYEGKAVDRRLLRRVGRDIIVGKVGTASILLIAYAKGNLCVEKSGK